jgi:hypothetical protein
MMAGMIEEAHKNPSRQIEAQIYALDLQHQSNRPEILHHITDTTKPEIQQEETTKRKSPFPHTLSNMFVDFATVPRDKFNNLMEIGVPLDETTRGAEEVLVLYTSIGSLPNDKGTHQEKVGIEPKEALENCHTVKVILQENAVRKHVNQCIAIVPQWESYAVHKFMRVPDPLSSDRGKAVNLTYPLRYVARTQRTDGAIPGVPSVTQDTLHEYLQNYSRLLQELKPFLKEVMHRNKKTTARTIIVLTCNKGQSMMFRNFVCNARAKGLDLSQFVMFATDEFTLQLSQDLGIPAWYDKTIFGGMPEEAAKKYGDLVFTRMMMAKVYCVHLALNSGYNILFQDVDVIWNRNPLPFLESKQFREWDMMFQGASKWNHGWMRDIFGIALERLLLTSSFDSIYRRR